MDELRCGIHIHKLFEYLRDMEQMFQIAQDMEDLFFLNAPSFVKAIWQYD
jgi:hypothetical protein